MPLLLLFDAVTDENLLFEAPERAMPSPLFDAVTEEKLCEAPNILMP